MKHPPIGALLELLARETATRPARPRPIGELPTLAAGTTRAPSPQLRARFEFAGCWERAILGMTWLSLADLRAARRTLAAQVALRRTNWPRSAPARFAPDALSVFAVDEDDQDETYLVWGSGEPRVFEYVGSTETIHRDLRAYLAHHLKTALALARDADASVDPTADLAAHLARDDVRLDRWVEGLARSGRVVLVRVALAAARLALPELDHPAKARGVLARAAA